MSPQPKAHQASPAQTPPPAIPASPDRRWWAFSVLSVSLLVIMLNDTILNVALPTIARALSATSSQLQWIVDAYILVFAGLLLTAGSLGDRFGRKRALTVGLAIFGAGAIWAAFADTAGQLIAARALSGIGGAFVMPATLSITTTMFSGAERTKAIGAWAGVSGLGIVIGPVTGGWLLKYFAWNSVFFINVPFIVAALIAGLILVPESRDESTPALDPLGAILSITGLTALLYGIIEAPAYGWTAGRILVAFGLAAILLVAFAVWELRSRAPMLDIRIFRNARFTAASLAVTLVFFALMGVFFFLTQYLQITLGFSALETGIRITPLAAAVIVASGIAARLTTLLGAKLVTGAAMLVVAAGMLLLSTASDSSGYGLMAIVLVVIGFGMDLAMTPATDAIMGALPLDKAGVGSAVNDTTRQVGGALGVAILGSLLSSHYRDAMEATAVVRALPQEVGALASDSLVKAAAVAQALGGEPAQAVLAAANHAFIEAMDRTVLVGAAVAVGGALIAFLFLPAREAAPAGAMSGAEVGTAPVPDAGQPAD